jgi:hypothetical protein
MIDNNEAERYIIVVTTILTIQQECTGLRPVPGFGAAHPGDAESASRKTLFPLFAAVGGMKEVAE